MNNFSKPLTLENLPTNLKDYDGTSVKIGVRFQNEDWFIKCNKKVVSESFSEFVASKVFKLFDVNCQEVILGNYFDEPTVLIKDFTSKDCLVHSFGSVNQSSEDTLIDDKNYSYNDVVYLIDKNNKLSSEEKYKCLIQFWDMFILDAILGNRDRHSGNWGYLQFADGHCVHSPVFDNNGSLFPGISHHLDKPNFKLSSEFLVERSDYFPASKFTIFDGERFKKINYYELFRRNDLPKLFYKRLEFILGKISNSFIVNLESVLMNRLIPSIYKEFYFKIILYRLGRIVFNLDYLKIEKGVDDLWKRSSLKNLSTQ